MSFSASREADGTRGVGPGGADGWMVLTPSFLLQGIHKFAQVNMTIQRLCCNFIQIQSDVNPTWAFSSPSFL